MEIRPTEEQQEEMEKQLILFGITYVKFTYNGDKKEPKVKLDVIDPRRITVDYTGSYGG